MADAELKVRIDAQVGDFSKALITANKNLGDFGNKVTSDLNKTASEAAKASAVLGGSLAKGSNSAAFALGNLGRVAQDAPFGFIGIQNNLNPLLESFQRLKAETGSTGGALKALGGSLLGAGGLGFALSAISAGILLYQEYQRKTNKVVTEAKKSTDEYANSLGQVARASLLGAQSAAQETTTLSLLYKQYTNGELTLEKRKSAYDQLQNLYPAYFGNIKFEQEASVKTKDAYDKLTTSIIATARARAAGDLITKNSQRQLENEQKLIDINTQILSEQTKQKQLQNTVDSQNLLAKQEANILTSKQRDILNQYLKAGFKENELISLKNNLLTDSNILTDKNLQLEKSVNAEIQKGAVLSGTVGGTDRNEKAIKEEKRRFFALVTDFKGIIQTGKKDLAKSLITGTPLLDINTLLSGASFIPDNIGKQLYTPFQILKDDIQFDLLPQLGTSFKSFFDDMLMNGNFSFKSLGESIKNTFLSVLASEATQGVLSLLGSKGGGAGGKKGTGIIGSVLGLFGAGSKIAGAGAAGTAGTAAAGTAATGGLLLPILGGIAAVAGIASLFKKKKVEPQPAFTTSNAFSSYQTSSIASGSGTVVFEISGTNLVGVLNRAGAKLQRFGP